MDLAEIAGRKMTEPRRQMVRHLANQILYHKRCYYAGHAEISDEQFDQLEQRLREVAPDHPVLSFVGTDAEIASGRKVGHAVPMLSLQKTYKGEDLLAWADGRAVVGTTKLDGNSLSLVYENGRLQVAKTRGDGRFGEDVTEKVRWVADVVGTLPESVDCELRGELFCPHQSFDSLCDEMLQLNLPQPTHPRNIVAGLLGRKSHIKLARFFNFMAFDVVPTAVLPFQREMEKFSWLQRMGFEVPDVELLSSPTEITSYLDKTQQQMQSGTTLIDGAVFSYDELHLHQSLGSTSHHPRYKMSFKWQGQTATATIDRLHWSTSRLGIVTPVAVIEPVSLSGATITNVTLHNAMHVAEHNLKPGDQIEIVRSGEVIPKFLRVIRSNVGNYVFPENCDRCNDRLEYDQVRLKCPNRLACPAQKSGGILNWIRAVEIDDLSEKRLQNLLDLELIDDCADLYNLTKEDLLNLPLTKEKMANKLLENIDGSRSVPLARFLNGLGIQGVGLTSWEKLLESFPSLADVQKASREDIMASDGFAEKTADVIVGSLIEKAPLIQKLLDAGVVPHLGAVQPVQKQPLQGKQVAITGTLSRPRKELENAIKAAGGRPTSSISKNTFALVSNDSNSKSSKMQKAKGLGVAIWSEQKLFDYLEL